MEVLFREISRSFNAVWLAAVVGTAVIPLVPAFFWAPFFREATPFFFCLAALMTIAILLPWAGK